VVYDPVRQRIVMFGGQSDTLIGAPNRDDTWEWDGNDWTERFPASRPSPRQYHDMVFDAARQRVVLFGGRESYLPDTFSDETWEYLAASRCAVARLALRQHRPLHVRRATGAGRRVAPRRPAD
jgi:hypothetical protein